MERMNCTTMSERLSDENAGVVVLRQIDTWLQRATRKVANCDTPCHPSCLTGLIIATVTARG
jgi:hypothetical protein